MSRVLHSCTSMHTLLRYCVNCANCVNQPSKPVSTPSKPLINAGIRPTIGLVVGRFSQLCKLCKLYTHFVCAPEWWGGAA